MLYCVLEAGLIQYLVLWGWSVPALLSSTDSPRLLLRGPFLPVCGAEDAKSSNFLTDYSVGMYLFPCLGLGLLAASILLAVIKHRWLLRGDAVVELGLNDYLDIFCPHYESPGPPEGPETFALYMVDWSGYQACKAEGANAFQRWKCSLPFAPFGPVRFSEKIQRFTPFSLGFEFLPGETYYYISVPTPESSGRCLRLQVSVCCKESRSESAHPVGSPGESGTSGWRGEHAPSPMCLLLLLLPILRLLRVLPKRNYKELQTVQGTLEHSCFDGLVSSHLEDRDLVGPNP